MKLQNIFLTLLILIFLGSCATYKPQTNDSVTKTKDLNKAVAHTFYLIGDAGGSELGKSSSAIEAFKAELDKASKNSTAIFLGDNIYEKGMPKKLDAEYELAKHRINVQIDAVSNFKGNTLFIPGNHDWYSGIKALKDQEKFIEKALGKNTFLPENGCPIEKIHVSEDIELIIIDSHWYVTDWDRHPTINDNCEFKTREDFLDEFDSLIKKARGKTTIVAIHHPMYTNGTHGGQYSFGSHMSPLPILGTFKNMIRRTGGIIDVDLQNKKYNDLQERLVTLAQINKKVIFTSGHDHNLQYIIQDNLHQIVSGSGSKISATRNIGNGVFSYGTHGFARLDIFEDGSSYLKFYSSDDNKVVFETEVFPTDDFSYDVPFKDKGESHTTASIYTEEETDVSGFHKFLWGERYRKYFSAKIKAPNVKLDTLFGGVIPIRRGGGNQSKSLRLEDKNGAQYVMRALRKQPIQYLQSLVFKDQYIEGQFEDTFTKDLILDVFAGSHPYAPFVIGDLADAIGVYHTNPTIYYVPKQERLGYFNHDFGDELYMIEEHTSEGHSDEASFGYQDELLSTNDMMKKLHKDEDIIVDEVAYIKARLFDMLIGDWDRHQDQWRWIEFKEDGKKVYRPMPRDRDQAFSIMADGFLLGTAVKLLPAARLLRSYSDDLMDVKGINVEPYPLDMELITQSGKDVWDSQVKLMQANISDDVIEKAFLNIPPEIRDETIKEIKQKLKGRRENLQKISDRYYNFMNKCAVIKGTNKDDWFDIERLPNGETKITAYRIKNGEKKDIFHQRTYNHEATKEIWIYALEDDDTFHVHGNGSKFIKIRLIGGQNNDTYNVENGKRIALYDYKSKNNTFVTNKGHKKLTDNYFTNVYDYKKLKSNTSQILPSIGANPDDGFRVGTSVILTNYGFERNPFSAQHKFLATYYFATNGFDLNYSGEFANIFTDVNFEIDLQFNSPNYAINFFGLGNETPNPETDDNDGLDVGLNYNRVKIRTIKATPSFVWRGDQGSKVKLGLSYESNEVERTNGRFIVNLSEDDPVFSDQYFYGVEGSYEFLNRDNTAFPTLGLEFALTSGYKNNTETEKGFGYIISKLGFNHKIIPSGQLVFATAFRTHINLGNDFEFYQGATLGANNGLRGYRNERFTGKTAFSQSTDIRWNFTSLKTGILPVHLGIFGGVDYGRVWVENDTSEKWNNSFGGGFFANFYDLATAYISAFNSDDGVRLAFRLGFGF